MPLRPHVGAALLLAAFTAGWPAAAQDEPPAAPAAQAAPDVRAALQAQAAQLDAALAAAADPEARFALYEQLARAYAQAGLAAEAMAVRDRLVEDDRIGPGRRALAAAALANGRVLMADVPRSRRLLARAAEWARQTGAQELELLPQDPQYATLHAQAELARRYQHRHDLALGHMAQGARLALLRLSDTGLSEKRRRAAVNELFDHLGLYTIVLVQNNRRHEALSHVTELTELARGVRPAPSAGQLGTLEAARAIALGSHDDYPAAAAAAQRAVAIYQAAGAPATDSGYGVALRMRLLMGLANGELPGLAREVDLLSAGRAGNRVVAGSFSDAEWEALVHAAAGRWAEAALRIQETISRNERNQGRESPFYKYLLSIQMLCHLADPAADLSLAALQSFVDRLTTDDADGGDLFRGSYVEDAALVAVMDRLLQLPDPAAGPLAFRIAETMRGNATQGAMLDGAARMAAADPRLRALVEQEQQLRFDQASSRATAAAALAALERTQRKDEVDEQVLKRQRAAEEDARLRLQAAEGRLRTLRRDIAREFPLYRELSRGGVASAAQIGAALRPGEAYLNLYPGRTAGYAFLVLPGGALHTWRLPVTRSQTVDWLGALRKPFDAQRVPADAADAAGFDLQASAALYQAWLAPLRGTLPAGGTVYLAAGGPLAGLPWSVLATAPAATLEAAHWWVQDHVPVQVPTGNALVFARRLGRQPATQPFLAFADPAFDGQAVPPAPSGRRGSASAGLDAFYRRVSRLPETLDEARAIAAALGAQPGSILHGTDATRSRVLREDLAQARVLAFATHGVLPGEVPGLRRAGLALAYEGRGAADSILTLDDIVGLRLNADWVLLSACNTGYATGGAGDALSALVRGFYAAGSRALLVTHWAVDSDSAKELTVATLRRYAAEPGLTRAAALAAVQREMIAGRFGSLYRHPYFWGAWQLAGDGGR